MPECTDSNLRKGCIETFSASQLSSLVSVLIFLYYFIQVKYEPTGMISIFVNTSVFFSIFYFVLTSWIVEERYFYQLRNIKTAHRHIEFFIRVLSLILLSTSFFAIRSTDQEAAGVFPASLGLLLLTMATLYLIWDWIFYLATGNVSVLVHADFWLYIAAFFWLFAGTNALIVPEFKYYIYGFVTLLFLVPLFILWYNEKDVFSDFLSRLNPIRYRERVR